MTVATLTIPKCSMDDGIDMLDGALVDLDSARHALAYLVEIGPEDGSRSVLECVINTLDYVAKEARTGPASVPSILSLRLQGRATRVSGVMSKSTLRLSTGSPLWWLRSTTRR